MQLMALAQPRPPDAGERPGAAERVGHVRPPSRQLEGQWPAFVLRGSA